MTLTADQLEEIIDGTASDDPDVEMKAIDAARRDLAAMRQPITAEALTAAGWKESSASGIWDYPSDHWDALWHIQVVTQEDGSLERVMTIDGCSINAFNMYALDQLVELLGGGA